MISALACSVASTTMASPETLTLGRAPSPKQIPIRQGSSVAPDGTTLSADSLSLLQDGVPIMPVCGEFHYTRLPREEWRTQLLRMKAAGITVVSTYVIWIHHEEEQGVFRWEKERDLRHFVSLCGELGLQAIIRVGPWSHAEVRDGGHPGWVMKSGTKLRTTDPRYLALVRPFYREISRQVQGLFWKDGGPIVAVQIENECDGPEYLLRLREMAREEGLDAPWYTITGWNGIRLPEEGFLPLFGAYSVAFWYPHGRETWKKSFFFSLIRDDGDMGAQFTNTRPARADIINRFPYLCCEIGGGMPSSRAKRVNVSPREISAMSLVKLANGSNMPGYYMFQGGFNPEGRLSTLQEEKPNAMPVIDYDFQAPLAATGLANPQLALLRRQHLFISAHAATLARMTPMLPERAPTSIQDMDTPRWAVRHDGRSGFLFLNNHQPGTPLPSRRALQFELRDGTAVHRIPSSPVDVPADTHGIIPLGLELDGLRLLHVTADHLGTVRRGDDSWELFGEIDGLPVEFAIAAADATRLPPQAKAHTSAQDPALALVTPQPDSARPAFSYANAKGGRTHVILLSSRDADRLHRLSGPSGDVLALSEATVHVDAGKLVIESLSPSEITLSLAKFDSPEGPLFRTQQVTPGTATPLKATLTPLPVTPEHTEDEWSRASRLAVNLPALPADGLRRVLRVTYQGDAARLLVNGRLHLDNFYNGKPMDIPLWRIPAGATLVLETLPLPGERRACLPAEVAAALPSEPAVPTALVLPIHRAECGL